MAKVMEKSAMKELEPMNPAVDRFQVVLENGIKIELRTSSSGITFFPQYQQ